MPLDLFIGFYIEISLMTTLVILQYELYTRIQKADIRNLK